MKLRNSLILSVAFAVVFLVPGSGTGDEYYVSDAASLDAAMTSAESTVGIGDTINMAAGTYSITSTLYINDSSESSLALIGQGPGQTFLDGNGTTQILRIDTSGGTGPTSRILIKDLTLMNGSSATQGGAAWVRTNAADLFVDNVHFLENESVSRGGGLYFLTASGDLEVMSSWFFSNQTTGGSNADGGGMYASLGSTGSAAVEESNYEKNFVNAGTGGGAHVAATNGTITVERNQFTDNDATTSSGGGLYVQTLGAGGVIEVENCLIEGNEANLGGGLNAASASGPMSIVNVTAVNNSAVGAGAMHASLSTNTASLEIYNSIFYGNSKHGLAGTDIYVSNTGNGSVTVQYNSYEDLIVTGSGAVTESNNIDVDPLLDSGYMLSAGSSCIDAGDNSVTTATVDLAGNTRKVDDPDTSDTGSGTAPIIDMGAYEFQPSSSGGGGGGGCSTAGSGSGGPVWMDLIWIGFLGGMLFLLRRKNVRF